MATDLFGPGLVDNAGNSTNAVTTRPTEGRIFGLLDTWFRDCTSNSSQDGTVYAAAFFNMLLDELRTTARGNGLKLDGLTPVLADANVGSMLLTSIQLLIQRGLVSLALDTGAANNVVVALNPAPPELVDGMMIVFKAAADNTGPTTLSIGGVLYQVVLAKQAPLVGGEIAGGDWHTARVTIKTVSGTSTTTMRLNASSLTSFANQPGSALLLNPKMMKFQQVRGGSTSATRFTTSGQFVTRLLNTEKTNQVNPGAALNTSTGYITLPANAAYRIKAVAVHHGAGLSCIQLYDRTNNVQLDQSAFTDSHVDYPDRQSAYETNVTVEASIDEVRVVVGATPIQVSVDHASFGPVLGKMGDDSTGFTTIDCTLTIFQEAGRQ